MGNSLGSTKPSQRLALHFNHVYNGGGHIHYHITMLCHCRWSIPPSCFPRAKQEFHQVCNVFTWLCPQWGFICFPAYVIQRHCCCSSWKWREQELSEVCCRPELFEYGALGRGRWPTAAHPHGPPCDKLGNVE